MLRRDITPQEPPEALPVFDWEGGEIPAAEMCE
jgi:hypothetical protein